MLPNALLPTQRFQNKGGREGESERQRETEKERQRERKNIDQRVGLAFEGG